MNDETVKKHKRNLLKEENLRLKEECEEYKDKYKRSIADFQNFKRNKELENERIRKTASKNVILNMLEVLDNFKRALMINENNEDLKVLYNVFLNKLEESGAIIYGNEGDVFNCEIHDAISTEFDADYKDVIKHVVKSGCKLNGEIIRHAQVIVSV